MSNAMPSDGVGPVLHAGPAALAVVAAIRSLNPGVVVEDRGTYLRVLAHGVCRVTRAAIEREVSGSFRLPADLEAIMWSFSGQLSLSEDEVSWRAGAR